VELGVHPIEGVVLVAGTALELLAPTNQNPQTPCRKERRAETRKKGSKQWHPTWETRHAGPPWTLSASFNARSSVAPWLRSSP
jgi:hypothetical protein